MRFLLEALAQASVQRRLKVTSVVSGGAAGIDTLGEIWARSQHLAVHRYPADWARYGKAAGPIRNRQMALNAEALLAIWDGKSPGTAHMIGVARQLGLRVFVYQPNKTHDN